MYTKSRIEFNAWTYFYEAESYMMILTRYILKEHITPFIYSFLVIIFIFILDLIIQIADLIISKGLHITTILELFVYNVAWMTALAIPMAVLVATVMAFGRLSSDNEITAIKSSGTSLYKIISPVIIVSCIIATGLVHFNNKVLPECNHKAKNLMSSIHKKRPTLIFKEGIFQNISGYSIIVQKLDQKTSEMEDIKIFDQNDRKKPVTINAKRGKLQYSADGDMLSLDLFDGEIHEVDDKNPNEYRIVKFKQQTLHIAEVGTELKRLHSSYRGDRELSSAMMLDKIQGYEKKIAHNRKKVRALIHNKLFADLSSARLQRKSSKTSRELQRYVSNIQRDSRLLNKYWVEVYKKYSIPFACIVFVLIGAPLGIMARQGGMAMGVGLSIGFFVLYWIFLIGGEDLADRGIVSPFWAMWSPNFLLGGIGIYLIKSTVKETKFIRWDFIRALKKPTSLYHDTNS